MKAVTQYRNNWHGRIDRFFGYALLLYMMCTWRGEWRELGLIAMTACAFKRLHTIESHLETDEQPALRPNPSTNTEVRK